MKLYNLNNNNFPNDSVIILLSDSFVKLKPRDLCKVKDKLM